MPYLDGGHTRTYFSSAGSGPVLLLTHGFLTTSEMWDGQIGPLSRDWTVVTWDMPGHGRTGPRSDGRGYDDDAIVASMIAILGEQGADRAVLVGFSLGGFASLQLRHEHPDRVRGLVLCGTGPGFRQPEARATWNDRLESTARRLQERGLAVLENPAMGPEVTGATTHRSAEGLIGAARGFAQQKDARIIDSLPAIDCPTLLTVGANDRRFVSAAEYMHRKIPASRLALIPDAGHAANLDNPDVFNTVVMRFLDETVRGASAGERRA